MYNTMPTLKLTKPAPEFSESGRDIIVSQTHLVFYRTTAAWLYWNWPNLYQNSEGLGGINVSQTHLVFYRTTASWLRWSWPNLYQSSEGLVGASMFHKHILYFTELQHHGYIEVDQTCTRVQRDWWGHKCFTNTSCILQNYSIMASLKLAKPAPELWGNVGASVFH